MHHVQYLMKSGLFAEPIWPGAGLRPFAEPAENREAHAPGGGGAS